ncbi:hypothetical protein, conserved [Eimeria acervulina]|uniref:Uncharacterized protein n=1 Tax=Eimeria acervulina TaxID=5801 RepID=U6GI08_EIMAC|nr:hypothetical protein, conserved [Eimeria acervulina]CDI78214.1 hypothetical protein, conserved [Eimeria acervulina]
MSKLSAFFEKKKKKVTKVAAPAELTQIEKAEEPIAEDGAEWTLELQQDAGGWAAAPASPAGGGAADSAVGRSLRVSAVGAYEIESKKDKSWSTMKRLEEEQRRGLQELREQEAREFLLQQQLEQGLEPQQDAAADVQQSQEEAPPPKQEENKLWVSTRVLRAQQGGASLRRARGTRVPSFDEDPDLATAVQLISSKPQQQQTKKQQQTRKSPSESQPDSSSSPSSKCDGQQQGSSSISDSEGSVTGPAAFTFDVQRFVSFSGLSGVGSALDAELVRSKYETRPPWTALAATEA